MGRGKNGVRLSKGGIGLHGGSDLEADVLIEGEIIKQIGRGSGGRRNTSTPEGA